MNDSSTQFNEIKSSKINILIKNYKDTIKKVTSQYNITLNNIYNSRKSTLNKRNSIDQHNNYYAKLVNNLKIHFKKKIQLVKNITYTDFNSSSQQKIKNSSALIIGINYIGSKNQLGGCINDANSIYNLLRTYGFKNIKLITDNTNQKPKYNIIINEFKNLLKNAKSGDTIFFFYSGHGSNTLDKSGDEKTGNDQMIIPCDFKCILDDDLKKIINNNLKKNVTLIAFFDSCFSGSVLDLKYQYLDSLDNNNNTKNDNETDTNGKVIMISGCSDIQTSADSIINNKRQGAMTWAFLETFNSQKNITWRQLLLGMRNLLTLNGFQQIPQLSSGKIIKIDSQVFI